MIRWTYRTYPPTATSTSEPATRNSSGPSTALGGRTAALASARCGSLVQSDEVRFATRKEEYSHRRPTQLFASARRWRRPPTGARRSGCSSGSSGASTRPRLASASTLMRPRVSPRAGPPGAGREPVAAAVTASRSASEVRSGRDGPRPARARRACRASRCESRRRPSAGRRFLAVERARGLEHHAARAPADASDDTLEADKSAVSSGR
jgi:hypothetical protein